MLRCRLISPAGQTSSPASMLPGSLPASTLPKKAGEAFPQTWRAKTGHYSVLITIVLHITRLRGFKKKFLDKALAWEGPNSSNNPGHSLFISNVWTIDIALGHSFNSCLSTVYTLSGADTNPRHKGPPLWGWGGKLRGREVNYNSTLEQHLHREHLSSKAGVSNFF